MALSVVLLPAPLGPISPTMRPSSMRRSTPSRAMVLPKALRRPGASMHGMGSALLGGGGGRQQVLRRQAEALNGRVDLRPLLAEKPPALAVQQQRARPGVDEQAEASSLLDQLFVDQLLIALQNRQRIDPIFGHDIAHRGERIAFAEHAVEDHGHDPVAKLAVDRLTLVPFSLHDVFPTASGDRPWR